MPSLSARDLLLCVPCGDDGRIRALDVLVVRAADGTLRAFENSCPHQGGPLNAQPGAVLFSRPRRSSAGRTLNHTDATLLRCARHGARFAPEDGACVSGPCAGHALHAVSVDESLAGVTISLEEARRAALAGGRIVQQPPDGGSASSSLLASGGVGGSSSRLQVILHPLDGLAMAAAEEEQRAGGDGAIEAYPLPRSPVPLEADGVTRCTWDGRLGCWRAADGSVRLR